MIIQFLNFEAKYPKIKNYFVFQNNWNKSLIHSLVYNKMNTICKNIILDILIFSFL